MDKIYTGFEKLDKHLKICKGDLVVIGGRPAIGKTSFLINLLINLSKSNVKCKFFSLELYDKELKAKISKAVGEEAKTLEIVFSNTTFDDEMTLTKEKLENGIDEKVEVVIIDYLQLIGENRHTTKDKIKMLKEIAKQKNVVVFVASSISKVFVNYKHPPKLTAEWLINKKRLWEPFDMGNIDKFIFIDRPDKRLCYDEMFANDIKKYVADLVVVQNKNGALGSIECGWNSKNWTFYELP